MRKVISLLLTVTLLFALAGCRKADAPKQATAVPKLKVIATVYPVYEFVRQVGGDKVEVSMLLPAGAEPHAWEPTAKDLVKIREAKAVFYHGAGLEGWAAKLLTQDKLGSTQAIEVSKGIPLLKEEGHNEHGHSHSKDHSSGQLHDEETDPHVWLDPVLAQQEVRTIADALAALDSENQSYYKSNADKYISELQALHKEFEAALTSAIKREIVTNHAAFGYLAARYQLKQLAIMGLAPDAEPTPDKMAKIVQTVREHKIGYIFSETLVSAKLAETIARETGAKVLVLHPIDQITESELKAGQNYLTLMRGNLANLKKALAGQ